MTSAHVFRVDGSNERFRLSFTFDSDLPCQFTILTCIADNVDVGSLNNRRYPPPCMVFSYCWYCNSVSGDSSSATFKYDAGSEQQFSEEDHVIEPSQLLLGDSYDPSNGSNTIPLAILMETDSSEGQFAAQAGVRLEEMEREGYHQ